MEAVSWTSRPLYPLHPLDGAQSPHGPSGEQNRLLVFRKRNDDASIIQSANHYADCTVVDPNLICGTKAINSGPNCFQKLYRIFWLPFSRWCRCSCSHWGKTQVLRPKKRCCTCIQTKRTARRNSSSCDDILLLIWKASRIVWPPVHPQHPATWFHIMHKGKS